jgi:hypothetical protein
MRSVDGVLTPFELLILRASGSPPECFRSDEQGRKGVVAAIDGMVREKMRIYSMTVRNLYEKLPTEKIKADVKSSLTEIEGDQASLVYGDIDFFSFANILVKIKPRTGEIFVDLGSGTGRAVAAAMILYGDVLSRSVGIEILPRLHRSAASVINDLILEMAANPTFASHSCEAMVEEGDVLDEGGFNWTTGDIIFINSTCFSDTLFQRVAAKCEQLKSGTRVLTLTKHLTSSRFKISSSINYTMSWGLATCFFQTKL